MLCLTRPTDPGWLDTALAHMDAVLADHAHCEMKAASNALALAARTHAWPQVVHRLVELAEEELGHFRRVIEMLERRRIPLGPPTVDPYAGELRRLAQRRPSPFSGPEAALIDRMLVAALIEARSSERFRLLGEGLRRTGDVELVAFYDELFAAEAGHFRTFVDLAVALAIRGASALPARARTHRADAPAQRSNEPAARCAARPSELDARALVRARLSQLAESEGDLSARLGVDATVHG